MVLLSSFTWWPSVVGSYMEDCLAHLLGLGIQRSLSDLGWGWYLALMEVKPNPNRGGYIPLRC